MASMTTVFRDGSEVEVGIFGYESVIGASALLGVPHSLNRIYTQIAGQGYRCSLANAAQEFERAGLFRALVLRYVQMMLLQSTQSTACNARHTVEQRLARWLLICAERTGTSTFILPHVFLADMLGTRRPTISTVANAFQRANLIRYSRGHLEILDTDGLKVRACECYGIIHDLLQSANPQAIVSTPKAAEA